MPNLYLIGMMGSGKTATGKALAAILGYEFVDLDLEIEKKEGRSIAEIFEQSGEPYFRDVETRVLKEFSVKQKHVFGTGGGIVLKDENIEVIKATGRGIFLETSLSVLWERIRHSKDRPLLNTPDPKGTLERIMENREYQYTKASGLSVLTDGLSPQQVAKQIAEMLK